MSSCPFTEIAFKEAGGIVEGIKEEEEEEEEERIEVEEEMNLLLKGMASLPWVNSMVRLRILHR